MDDTNNPYASPTAAGVKKTDKSLGEYAPCPSCQNTVAKKISFTWWGGAVGPRLFTHVKCNRCGNQYNGKTGRSNATAITIYVVVGVMVGLAIGLGLPMLLR